MNDLIKLKKFFFTEDVVKKLLDKKKARVLSKFGALTRTAAQRSMRSRKKASEPGQPPSAHGKKLLRKLLFFAFDGKDGVVVGPILKQSTRSIGVPRTMEKGGTITGKHKGKQVTSNYPARPFMGPAGNQYIGQLPQWYADL